jgi:mannose/fructose/N-acetylgalactosamine-specific phosphotransferase system component IIB
VEIMIELVRIDDKLIHAQIIWGWARSLNASCVIVANDEAASDELRQRLLIMVARSMESNEKSPIVKILSLKEAVTELKGTGRSETCIHERSILVVSRPADLVLLIENGVSIKDVSVGWMSFYPGKRRIFETVSVDEEDIEAFRELISKGVSVKYQASPSDVQLDMAGYIIDF